MREKELVEEVSMKLQWKVIKLSLLLLHCKLIHEASMLDIRN